MPKKDVQGVPEAKANPRAGRTGLGFVVGIVGLCFMTSFAPIGVFLLLVGIVMAISGIADAGTRSIVWSICAACSGAPFFFMFVGRGGVHGQLAGMAGAGIGLIAVPCTVATMVFSGAALSARFEARAQPRE